MHFRAGVAPELVALKFHCCERPSVHYHACRYLFARVRAFDRHDTHDHPLEIAGPVLTDPSVRVFLATSRNGFKRTAGAEPRPPPTDRPGIRLLDRYQFVQEDP